MSEVIEFRSRYANAILPLKDGIRVYFENNYYRTSDEEIIGQLRQVVQLELVAGNRMITEHRSMENTKVTGRIKLELNGYPESLFVFEDSSLDDIMDRIKFHLELPQLQNPTNADRFKDPVIPEKIEEKPITKPARTRYTNRTKAFNKTKVTV